MQGAVFSYALLAALAIALLYAAFTDLRRREIDNWLNAAIALSAPLYWWASDLSMIDIGWQIGLAVLAFGLAVALFTVGQMGGGDVKLIGALALWIAPVGFVKLAMMMALLGYLLTMLPAIPNMDRSGMTRARQAVTLLCGAAGVVLSGYAIWMLSGGAPISFGGAPPAGPTLLGNAWLRLALLVAGMTAIGLGMMPIVRRQRSRLATPYGVAIAGGGLWLLASEHLFAGTPAIISG